MTKSNKPLKASAQAFNIQTEAVSTVKPDSAIQGLTKAENSKRLIDVIIGTTLRGVR